MIDRIILFPYSAYLGIRSFLYDRGVLKSRATEVPSICVGNVTVGGTGKTPHVEMIIRELLDTDEWGSRNIAVLSRGYKRESKGFQQVTREGSAAMFGDEPLQVKKKFPIATVAVDNDRVEGADLLVHPEKIAGRRRQKCWNPNFPPADIIILDDAFQHRRIKADVNVVLVDINHPVNRDSLLPIGRLRDLPRRIHDADVLIVTKCDPYLEDREKGEFAASLGFKDYDPGACTAVNRKGRTVPVLFTSVCYGKGTKLYSTSDQRYFYSQKVILFSGIANDTPLRNFLSDSHKVEKSFKFPDHHRYTRSDISRIHSAVKRHPTASVVTTEKDAQRILDYTGMPQNLMERMFYIPVSAEFLSEKEKEVFRSLLTGLRRS